jgi:hypothetical protein
MFKPRRYAYEPMSIRRQRELAKFDTLRDQVSPLVAKGDPLSLMKAQQALRQSNIDKQKQATNKRNWMTKVGESVKKRLEAEREVARGMGNTPPEVQGGADRESNLKRITKMGPVPGVPLGVAEAFPEKVTDETRRYGKPGRLEESAEAVVRAGEVVDTPGRVLRGIAAGLGPSDRPLADIPGNIRTALTDGQSFRGVDTGAISKLPDEEFGFRKGPVHITPKTVAGLGIEALSGAPFTGVTSANVAVRGSVGGAARSGAKEAIEGAADPVSARVAEAVQAKFRPGAVSAPPAAPVRSQADRIAEMESLRSGPKPPPPPDPRAERRALSGIRQDIEDVNETIQALIREGGNAGAVRESKAELRYLMAKESEMTQALKGGAPRRPPAGTPIGGGASRTGNRLLQLPDTQQLQAELGRPPELKDIFNVDRMGRREATAQANRLRSQSQLDFRALGRTTKDAKGNLLVRGIAPDAQDMARGQEFAPLLKVLEKPQNYNLTPEQAQAAQRLAGIPEIMKAEREAFGVGPRVLDVDPDEQFIWRKAKTDSKGTATNKPRASAGGTRLGGGGDKARVFKDIDDALDAGVVYAHPQEAFDQNVMGGLKKSVDEHVKSMLVPMSDSAAQRVSPKMRAQNDYLQKRLTSLKGTLGRLDARTNGIVDAYINSASPDLDAMYDELGQVASRAGKLPPQVAADLKQTMADIRAMRPAWRREIRQSQSVPAGRATVPNDVAPALQGRDFEPRVAQKIEDFYRRTARVPLPGGRSISLKADIPAMRAVSAAVTPIRATGDLSAIMINQTTTAARHPLTFAKNVAMGMRDLVADTPYNQWLSSGVSDDGARHGLAIVGEAGEQLDLQFSNWMQRIPGIRQVNNHYVRFNNRQRVDLYNLAVRARGGAQNVDDATKESIANAINRFTGVSNSRATDAETLASFAPNFTRAHIETVAAALSKGGIEGNMAREYLLTMLVAGGGMVAGVAAAQGRDLSEVLHPLSLNELKDGKVRINPNFMSVRAFGQDIKVFGKYDSLMRLLAVTSDAGLRSALEGDAMQVFDAVGYASGGMGSPAASFLTSLVKGETFEGAAPLSLEGLASNVTPFTGPELVGGIGSAAGNIAQGDFGAAANDLAGTGVLAIGGKASPVTAGEQIDLESQRRYGVDYRDTNKDQRRELDEQRPDLVEAYERSARGPKLEELKVKDQYKAKQEARDAALLAGTLKREDWQNQYYDDLTAKHAELKQIYGDRPITKPKDAMEKYAKIFQDAEDPATGIMDRDKVDAGMAALTTEERAIIDGRVGMDDTPLADIFRDVREVRRQRNELPKYRGFTAKQAEDIDEVWQEVRNNARSADRLDMLRALRYYLGTADNLDGAVIAGVRKRINQHLSQLPVRERFSKAHPELNIFYGNGKLTKRDIDFLNARLAEA